MHRLRALVVVAAATTMTFTGLVSASAASVDRDHGIRAQIVRISDHAWVEDRGKVDVEATYKCWGKGRDVTTTVSLTQRSGARYDATVKGDLRCDGNRQTQRVQLDRHSRDRVRNGDAKVTWEYSADRRSLDREYAKVDVRGADKGHH